MDRIAEAAPLLAAARLSGMPVKKLPLLLRPRDEAEAYMLQQAVHDLLARSRYRARVGYKIGCTTPVMQKQLGVAGPVSGGLFAGTMYESGVRLSDERFQRIGIEVEIAVRLGRDLPAGGGPYDGPRLKAAVEAYMAAIEVVDDRYADWQNTDTPTLIADDFFAAAGVLGQAIPAGDVGDPALLTGTIMINGTVVGRGKGSDVMGQPLAALAWLANGLNTRGQMLKAGEIVFLGSLVEAQWVEPGDAVTAEISGLGRVTVAIE